MKTILGIISFVGIIVLVLIANKELQIVTTSDVLTSWDSVQNEAQSIWDTIWNKIAAKFNL